MRLSLRGVLLFIILNLIILFRRNKPGLISGFFLILYGFFRIICENFREPDSHIGYIFQDYSVGTLLSFVMILFGILYSLRIINAKRIDKIFFKDKSIPIDLFLDKILYHKKLGYYQKKNPFGKRGDFVTAPNISNVFSEMIAIWFVSFWENLNRPDRINFIELGPGNGDFSLSLINTLKRFLNLSKATKIYLYERSEKLIGIQKKKINSRKVSWIKNFDRINDGPVIFFGNEFLDALPIKQFKKIKNNIYEKHVLIKNKKINFILKKASKVNIKKLRNYNLLDDDGIIEYPVFGFKELDKVCSKIRELNGGALFIDYGYYSKKNIDTLQSVFKHNFNDLSKNVSNSDVTSLVNFDLYKRYFIKNDLYVEKIITQSEFLQKMGILERYKILSDKMNNKKKINLHSRIQRLINPSMMGQTFKVIFTKDKKCKFSLAFR